MRGLNPKGSLWLFFGSKVNSVSQDFKERVARIEARKSRPRKSFPAASPAVAPAPRGRMLDMVKMMIVGATIMVSMPVIASFGVNYHEKTQKALNATQGNAEYLAATYEFDSDTAERAQARQERDQISTGIVTE